LARPCQFRPAGTRDSCEQTFWTSRRLSEPVIAALDAAIDRLAPMAVPPRRLVLIGYSGGGAAAVLLAARRTDVAGVVSVAGNISLAAWTAHHRLSPLTGSLDPADWAARLGSVPQLHLIGGDDRIVPRLVADGFVRRVAPTACLRVETLAGVSHDKGWLEAWPAALERIPTCVATPRLAPL
jgi:dienelactone hydrolase